MAFRILAFVFPLGLDTLAVAIALGLQGFRPWRPAPLFCAFEAVMPLFGIALAPVVSLRFEYEFYYTLEPEEPELTPKIKMAQAPVHSVRRLERL